MRGFSRGFTIIELIVVIAIMVALAAIVIAGILSYIQSSEKAAILGNVRQMANLANDFYSNSGTYSGFCASANSRLSSIEATLQNETNTNSFVACIDENTHFASQGAYNGQHCQGGTGITNDAWMVWGAIYSSTNTPIYCACIDSAGDVKILNKKIAR